MKINELAQKLDVSVDTVRLWRKNGLPCAKDDKGRIVISEAAAAEWFARTGKMKHAGKLIAVKAASNKRQKQRLADMSESNDLESMLDRCRQAELDAWNIYQSASPQQKLFMMEQHRQQAEARRKVEKDIAFIRQSQDEVAPIAEMERSIANMAIACRNDLLSIPNSLADQVVGLTAGEICVKLRESITDALRHISGGNNDK